RSPPANRSRPRDRMPKRSTTAALFIPTSCPRHHSPAQPVLSPTPPQAPPGSNGRGQKVPKRQGVHPKTQSGEAGHTNGRSVDVHSQNPRTSENEDHHRCPTRSSAYATGSPPMTPPPHRWPTCSVTGMTPTPWPSPKSAPHSPPPP